MPIYEYVCERCGRLTEVMQKLGDPPPPECPECGAGPLARLVSRTTFQLKGGGWYSDLYASPRKDGERRGTHASREPGTEAASPAPAADAKPAAKPAGPASKPSGSGKKARRA